MALALAGAAAAATSASAAECRNEAIREQQGATRLPECRAFELVSPVDKGGHAIRQGMSARADGGGLLYWSTGAFAGGQSNIAANFRALRSSDGWTTTALNPPTTGRNPVLMDQFYVVATSADFSRALIDTRYPVDPGDAFVGEAANSGYPDLYAFELDGSFDWLTPAVTIPDLSGVEVSFGTATPDLGAIVFRTAKQVIPSVAAGAVGQLYVRHGDEVVLVSAGADGRPLASGAAAGRDTTGAWTGSGSILGGRAPTTPISDDGATIWFASLRAAGLSQLYVRSDALDPARAATTHVSVSQATATAGTSCGGNFGASLLAASADGATAYFSCTSQLTDDVAPEGGVYRYDRAGGTLTLLAAKTGTQDVLPLAADRRADHVWLVSAAVLASGATAGSNNLYLAHGGTVRYVARLGNATPVTDVAVSPDGSRLAFATNSGIDPLAGGLKQVYLADAGRPGGTPVCVSCRPDGTVSARVSDFVNAGATTFLQPNVAAPSGAVRDDGTVTFVSADDLLPEDVDGAADVYQRLADGRLVLITGGSEPLPSVFAGASADGRDVFVLTSERLAPQDTDNGSADLYTARVDGGFALPQPPSECVDTCQGPPLPPFVAPQPPTAAFDGPGDVLDPGPARPPGLRLGELDRRRLALWARRGRTTLGVRAWGAGTVRATVRGRLGRRTVVVVARASATVAGHRPLRLQLRLASAARAHLRAGRPLRLTIAVSHSQARGAERVSATLRPPTRTTEKGGRR